MLTTEEKLLLFSDLRSEILKNVDCDLFICLWLRENNEHLRAESKKYVVGTKNHRDTLYKHFPELLPFKKEITSVIDNNKRRLEIVELVINELRQRTSRYAELVRSMGSLD